MAGIGVGVFSLVVVISVMNGFNESIRKRFLAVEPTLIVYFNDESKGSKKNWKELQAELLVEKPDLKTSYFEQQDVMIKTVDGYFAGAQIKGIEKEALNQMMYEIARAKSEKSYFDKVDIELEPGQVIVGIDLARQNGIFEGDELTLVAPESLLLPPGEVPLYERVSTSGFLESQITTIDEHTVFYLIGTTMKNLRETASFRQGAELFIDDPMDYHDLQKKIQAYGFSVESWTERNSALFSALRLEFFAIGLVLALSALIASFSVVTVLILLTTQKRKEIGLMMAIGLSPSRTRWLFTRLGMMISGLGMGGGLILGTLVSLYIQNNPLNVLPSYYQDTRVPALVDYQFIAIVAVAVLLIAVVAAWLPAKQVAEMNPVAALRSLNRS